ncbi:Type III restriction enzyme, res subunit [Microbacterium oxydans]|uniref:Type III restriction enzyme, res subunit n=1 Tax=Microbacterium oxydans TaxID=82380 RepID=A0A0F0KZN8_9MICO|nr:DEAD/DEAH box helicase family protein [Microbacterium oxydans]KJL25899.1 Type III restriction enzyme, res subunit [Microbacterium oxydans]
MNAPALPLSTWRFRGTLRTYQAEVLERIEAGSDEKLHIVAPPGSGKTLLGLLLAAREGHRVLVLTPTVTIREQWLRTARDLAPDASAVSEDPRALGDLTVLTYQLLSVTGDGSPFEGLARRLWVEELADTERSEADAATWLATLEVDNPAQYRAGLRRRVRRVRRRFAQQRPDELARVLHPNAVALIDTIVDAGIRTIVLDECHHLLDHWALVVAYLAGRIRATGARPVVIGLTATLPSPEDETEYDNYTQLLGDVDYEVPTPAVVKEGHLAPYRDHVWFTEPEPEEAAFIRRHESLLEDLVLRVLSSPDGLAYLEEQLQPAWTESDDPDAGTEEDPDSARRARLERALSADFTLTRSAGVVLKVVAPAHPLTGLLPPPLFGRCTTDDLLTILTRFAQTRLLTDPAARGQWDYVRRALADFGHHLTDRGLRRGRSPLETTLTYSASKDRAAVDILHRELDGDDGARIRVVVVTDFVEHGNHRGLAGEPAGALRVFERFAADEVIGGLHPVLLTARHLRVRAEDAVEIAAGLRARLGTDVSIAVSSGTTCDLQVPETGRSRLVSAVSELIGLGIVRVLVGTRGLLGEGWDCPSVNTLIDLTAVATSTGTQQLRGRTLRLDPAWPDKVAHNWSIACLIPAFVDLDSTTEALRLRRRHGHLWGLSADDDTQIVSGLGHALPPAAIAALDAVLDKADGADVDRINDEARARFRTRSQTRSDWRVGEPWTTEERDVVAIHSAPRTRMLRTGTLLGAALPLTFGISAAGISVGLGALGAVGAVALPAGAGIGAAVLGGALSTAVVCGSSVLRAMRRLRDPASLYRGAAVAVSQGLHDAGRIRALDTDAIQVRRHGADEFRIEVAGMPSERTLIADAVQELFSPAENPRFLLRVDQGVFGRSGPVLDRISGLVDRAVPGRRLLPVPKALSRRAADAERFAARWQESVGRCELHELRGTVGLALLQIARSTPSLLEPSEPRRRVWG